MDFFFGENNNYHQIGNAYLESDITGRKNDTTIFHYDDPFRLVKNAFEFCLEEARLSTTIGSDIEYNKFCGQLSTIMKVISNKSGDLLSQFDIINENDITVLERIVDLPQQIRDTPEQKLLINNLTNANESKIKGCLFLADFLGSCKNFEKVTQSFGFHLMLKTKD